MAFESSSKPSTHIRSLTYPLRALFGRNPQVFLVSFTSKNLSRATRQPNLNSPNHHIISPLGILPQGAWAIPKQHSNIGNAPDSNSSLCWQLLSAPSCHAAPVITHGPMSAMDPWSFPRILGQTRQAFVKAGGASRSMSLPFSAFPLRQHGAALQIESKN